MRENCGARLFLMLLGLGCSGAGVVAADVSFKADLLPIFSHSCVACHLTGEEPGNLALNPDDAYGSLMMKASTESNLLRVKAGSVADSYLVHKLEGTHLKVGGKGGRMPLGLPSLDAVTIDTFKSWIAAGAPNN